MKSMKILLYFILTSTLFACKKTTLPPYKTKVTVSVVTEDHRPTEGITVRVIHDFLGQTSNSELTDVTNRAGIATTNAKSLGSLWIRTTHPNYYSTFQEDINNLENPKDYDYNPAKQLYHKIIVRKIIKPVSLFAKINDIPFPEKDQWIGFDLEKADWVKPCGIGEQSDVEFWLENEHLPAETINGRTGDERIEEIRLMHKYHPLNKQGFLDSRDEFFNFKKGTSNYEQSILFRMHPWKGAVKMRVPHSKGGIIAEKERYLIYSKNPRSDYPNDFAPEMRMPHHAPKAGYGAEFQWEKKPGEQSVIDEKLGFFIKTRVKLDEQGNELSAHYAKFITDVQIDIRGRIKFTSYFNPTPNDTNLEFDLKKNLFKNLKDSETPFLP
jgi:hypothetical protein